MRKVSMLVAVVFSVFMMTSSMFAAQVITYPADAPVFSIEFPDKWAVEIDSEEDAVYATSPDEEIELDIWALPEEDVKADVDASIKAAAEDIDVLLAEYVKDVKLGDAQDFEVNGVKFVEFPGTAKYIEDDSDVNISAAFFSPDGEAVFVLLYWGTAEDEQAYADDLKAIVQSVKQP